MHSRAAGNHRLVTAQGRSHGQLQVSNCPMVSNWSVRLVTAQVAPLQLRRIHQRLMHNDIAHEHGPCYCAYIPPGNSEMRRSAVSMYDPAHMRPRPEPVAVGGTPPAGPLVAYD